MPIGRRIRTNIPGESSRMPCCGFGFGKTPRTEMLPVVGLTRLLTKSMSPWWGKPSALQAHEDRQVHAGPRWFDLPLVDRPAQPQQGRLIHVEIGIHRVLRDDRGQQGLVLVHQVAERQVVAADVAVNRRDDLGKVMIELIGLHVFLERLDPASASSTAARSWSRCSLLTESGTRALIARSRA